MKNQDKYASVNKLVNLPPKRHLTNQQHQFNLSTVKFEQVPQSIKTSTKQLITSIEAQLQVYQDPSYDFVFPESKFPEVPAGQRNQINYELKMKTVEEDTFKPKLTELQIQQMRLKGEFQVESGMANVTIPYIWKVNDRLLRGRQTILGIWENGLAWCYGNLSQAQYVLKYEVPEQIKKLANLPSQFFTLIFGRRSLSAIYAPDYNRQVIKDFWTDILNNELKQLKNEIGHELLENLYLQYEPASYLDIYEEKGQTQREFKERLLARDRKLESYRHLLNQKNQFKNKLMQVETKFQCDWVKIRRKVLTKVSSEVPTVPLQLSSQDSEQLKSEKAKEQDRKILQKFHQQKYTIYQAHLHEHLTKSNISTNIIQALVTLITIISLIDEKLRLKHESLADIKQKITTDVQKKYRIRSKNYRYKQRLVEEVYKPIQQQIQKEFYEVILAEELKPYFNLQFQSIYQKFVGLRRDFGKLVHQKKASLKCLYVPERVFRTTFRLLPPYETVIRNGYYFLEKQKQITIDTCEDFWKFRLYGMRLKSWTINCAVFLIGFAWVGPFGLRCLFGVNDFKYDQSCHYVTGVRIDQTRPTVIGVFLKVLKGIRQSRQHFQSLPDRGLFGKNISRYYNYFQCYIFRLILVGILITLILYPISIILLSILCLAMVLTVWLWVPLIMLICYLFNILVFQFQSSYRPNGILIRGVPLLSLVYKILLCLGKSVFAVLMCFVIVPLVCAGYSAFLVLQRGFRIATDEIMLFLIKKLGRTPSKDTNIAKKISGPGMSRGYYCSIAEQDVYILTQSSLQQILTRKLMELTGKKIQSHICKYQQIMQYVLIPFGHNRPSLAYNYDLILNNKNALMQNFQKRSYNYMARYPNQPHNVRFTQDEIDQYFENCVKIVKNFVERENIGDWVFQESNVLNQDYDQFTRNLWVGIFGCGDAIFQPLEKIDTRFKLLDDTSSNTQIMRKNVTSVMKALQGEVKLTHRTAEFNPAKNSLLQKDRQIQCIRNLCTIHNENSGLSIHLNINKPDCLLVPPRNLQELKVYDIYQRQRSQRGQMKIIEE